MKSIYMIKNFKWHRGEIFNSVLECEVTSASPLLDCEQSLFFFRFSKGSARAQERLAAKPGDTRNESVTRVVICVSRAFCSTEQEKRETTRSLVLC